MVHGSAMETFDARLESFNIVYPLLKKTGSHSKGTRGLKWPHKSPTPAQVSSLVFRSENKSMLRRHSLPTQVSFITPQTGVLIIHHVFFAIAIWTGGKPVIMPL